MQLIAQLAIKRFALCKSTIINLTNKLEYVINSADRLASVADQKISHKGRKEPIGLRRVVLIKNQLAEMEIMYHIILDKNDERYQPDAHPQAAVSRTPLC